MLSAELISALKKGLFCFCVLGAFSTFAQGAELVKSSSFEEPKVAEASNEGELTMKQFVLQPGFKVELFAAEPLLANPVAFSIDERGRFFICETFRHGLGVTDIRGHMNWLDEDLASRSVEDRLAMLKRHEGANFANYSKRTDRLRLVWDSDNDGKADKATVFADGFTNPLSGIGSGVLAREGEVFSANLPDLWRLADNDDDGKADARRSLLYGFGLRVGFLGHDLHGLILGPDGKLYFTIGDRGASIIQKDRRVGETETGAVYRCNPDGSDLEVFCYGLRNPQEIAFDEFGDLFTVDNNSDGGDRARVLYLVEGADYGWRIGYQFLERPNSRGMWNSEKMWHPHWKGQAAYILPAIANLTDGPSGLAYYPGTGLPEKYRGNFLIVDFHGGKGSGIYAFSLKAAGAGYSLDQTEKFIWESLPTDVDFGLDGSVYFTDWVQGWGTTGKGRIYKVTHQEASSTEVVAQTKELLLTPMKSRRDRDLARLLEHADMRVRQRAHLELARRGPQGAQVLGTVARRSTSAHARVHAVWGLGISSRQFGESEQQKLLRTVVALLKDQQPEVAAQAAKVLGENKAAFATDELISALESNSPKVQMQAALALGKLKQHKAIPALMKLLRSNNNQDSYLRHAASVALAWIGDTQALVDAASSDSAGVRMGAVLALRRLERSEVSVFLSDGDPLIATEAARAINDVPINGAIADLAAFKKSAGAQVSLEMSRRIVNANYRAGTGESAKRLAELAQSNDFPEVARAEALMGLSKWERPSGRDWITGLWRPIAGARQQSHAVEALKTSIGSLISTGPQAVRLAAIEAATQLNIGEAGDALAAVVKDRSASANARVQALKALSRLGDARLGEIVQLAANDENENLRKEALRVQTETQASGASEQVMKALQSGTIGEKQSALGTLGNMPDAAADGVLLKYLDDLITGKAAKELHLDIMDAAGKRKAEMIKTKLEAIENSLPKDDELAPFRVALHGGNAEEGGKIFIERPEVACLKCHKVSGADGGEVGPNLSKLGEAKPREYILESILLPNKQIADGFEALIVETKDGLFYAGIVKSENDEELVLNSPEDGIVSVKKETIVRRQKGLSSMPEGVAALLSKRELRDLVEFLSSLK